MGLPSASLLATDSAAASHVRQLGLIFTVFVIGCT